ncbi:recombinase family protein (plasmid) [Streptosporangium sp. CA-135522]|uniref:recombinase family protein n=1 Tax=Streptosporangium sp. CA-135522 TaxID=3240072 RepID=UPI003D949547
MTEFGNRGSQCDGTGTHAAKSHHQGPLRPGRYPFRAYLGCPKAGPSDDTTTPEGRLFFHILAAFAEWERDLITARTLDGLEAARARGRTGGRKKKLKAYQVERARQMYDQTGDDGKRTYTVQQIADEIGVKRTTLNSYLRTTPPKSTHD